MGFGEPRTANQKSREIWNFARQLISELLLVENWQGDKKKEKDRIKKEIKSDYIGYSGRSGFKVSNSKVFSSELDLNQIN